jgi:hypothetical protein
MEETYCRRHVLLAYLSRAWKPTAAASSSSHMEFTIREKEITTYIVLLFLPVDGY